MDTRSVDVKYTIPVESNQKWAGVEFEFTKGSASDFPASSINIGDKVYYTHFAPNKMHPAAMQLKNAAAIDAMRGELVEAKDSGCEVFIGSHGTVASLSDVEFLISYVDKVKSLKASNKDAASFTEALKAAYPNLGGVDNVAKIATNLYK